MHRKSILELSCSSLALWQADWISQPIWGGKLEIIARRDIRKGEELFASFGPRANDNLYLYYGNTLCS